MAAFQDLVVALRRAEQQLDEQLRSVRAAISSLESGSPAIARQSRAVIGTTRVVRKRRRLSAAARKAISDAQKRRWAKQKAATKK